MEDRKEFFDFITEIPTEKNCPEVECNDLGFESPDDESLERTPSCSNPRAHLHKYQWLLTCIGMNICAFLFGLDTTISGSVQGSVYQRFGELEKLPWIGIAFPMGSVSVILLCGRMYALFEIKRLFIASIVIFEVGSALCGAAPTMEALIIGRVIASMGAISCYSGNLAYLSTFLLPKERPLSLAITGICWGLGAILGPVVGGAFATAASWRWAFYLNLPLAVVAAPIQLFSFPVNDPQPGMCTSAKLRMIDWTGASLIAAVFVSLMLSLSFSGGLWPWHSYQTVCAWTGTGISLVLFGLQQSFSVFTTPENRIFPISFIANRKMVLLYVTTASAATTLGVGIYYIPLFFQFTRGNTALVASVHLLPFIGAFIFGLFLAGGLLPLIGRYAAFYPPSGIMMLAGGVPLLLIDSGTETWKLYIYEVLIGAGCGLTFQNAYSIATVLAGPEKNIAVSFMNVGQIGSVALALAIAGTLYQNIGFQIIEEALRSYHLPDAFLRAALAGAFLTDASGGQDAQLQELTVKGVVKTISRVFAMIAVSGAVTLISGCFMSWEKLTLEMGG